MYIGNTSSNQAYAPQVAYFSGNASTTAFTLPQPVASVAQLIVVVANVVQNPSSAYTVSGNTITFTSAPPSGTNNIWVEYTSLITQIIAPSPGTVGTSQLASSTGSGSVVLGTSPTITSPTISGGTISNLAGNLTFASGTNGVVFNNSGATTNSTLNDYETGTWTPTVGGTATYTIQGGTYVKIGQCVVAWFDVSINSLGTGATTNISGLPFTSRTSTYPQGMSGTIGYFNSTANSIYSLFARIDNNSSTIALGSTTGASTTLGGAAIFGNGARLTGTMIYQANF